MDLQEKDWKYMRSIKDELLQKLCSRINQQSSKILVDATQTPHQRYGKLYGHIEESNKIIADCFDDWRRSRLGEKTIFLRRHKLLTDEHVNHLSERAQEWMKMIDEQII